MAAAFNILDQSAAATAAAGPLHGCAPVPRTASAVSLSDASEDDFLPSEVRTPQRTPQAKALSPPVRNADLGLASAAQQPRPAAPKASVLDLSGHQNLRRVDGATLSHNDAVRIVRLPACLETIADDFARGCPRLIEVDFSRCTQLRRIGDRFFAHSGAPLVRALKIDLTPCTQLRSIGADFAAGSRASVVALPSHLGGVGAGFAAGTLGGTPLIDVTRCSPTVAAQIAAQPTQGGAGRRLVRYAPRAPVRRQSLIAFAFTTAEQFVVFAASLLFKLVVALFRVLFGTSF